MWLSDEGCLIFGFNFEAIVCRRKKDQESVGGSMCVCVCVCVCCFLVGCRLGRKDLATAADAAACCANVCCAIRGFVTSIRVDYAICLCVCVCVCMESTDWLRYCWDFGADDLQIYIWHRVP